MHFFVRADGGCDSAAPSASSEIAPFGFIEQESIACPLVAVRSIEGDLEPHLECSTSRNAAQ
jgi:hypothetical protein